MLVVSAVIASACATNESKSTATTRPPALLGMVRDPALEVEDVRLPLASNPGDSMKMEAKDGDLLLVYFGYTSCPDVCPTTLSDISVALRDLPKALARRVTVAMVTVDPDRDTAMVLTEYLGHFFDGAIALRTDDPATLSAAATAFGVKYEVDPHEPGNTTYEVGHTATTYVINDEGRVVVEWPFGFESSHMTSDITHLLTTKTSTARESTS